MIKYEKFNQRRGVMTRDGLSEAMKQARARALQEEASHDSNLLGKKMENLLQIAKKRSKKKRYSGAGTFASRSVPPEKD